jgi:xylulokinase
MSLLGIDVGTTGCKAGVLDAEGALLALAYREYETLHPQPGWAELDSRAVWGKVKEVVAEAAQASRRDPITALAVSSLGEAMTPVSAERELLDRCILGHDVRGQEYVAAVSAQRPGFAERLHAVNGNILGAAYSAPKLAWLRDHRPDLFRRAHKFLLWSGLVGYLLGGEATADQALANRTLLFDLQAGDWSPELLEAFDLPPDKLPPVVRSGTVTGVVADGLAAELGLPAGVKIVAGGHDQCCTALGAGVVQPGQAVYGMGTFICVTPVYPVPPPSPVMLRHGLNIEHHVVSGLYASFLYNVSGGAVLRWARDTFARAEKADAAARGLDVYDQLLAEMPAAPTGLMALPHFAPCGPPTFDASSSGVILGLKLETSRGDLIKGLLEGVTYYFAEGLDLLAEAGLLVREYRATGGGARSDAWLQLTADILGQPISRLKVSECGVLGAAILAGVGAGVFSSAAETAQRCVQVTRSFDPSPVRHAAYAERLTRYKQLYPLLQDYLHGM